MALIAHHFRPTASGYRTDWGLEFKAVSSNESSFCSGSSLEKITAKQWKRLQIACKGAATAQMGFRKQETTRLIFVKAGGTRTAGGSGGHKQSGTSSTIDWSRCCKQKATTRRLHNSRRLKQLSLLQATSGNGQTEPNKIWSVVIPTYNRLPILQKCLDALESQVNLLETGIRDYEVVVIDDGSTDGTLEALTGEADRYAHLRLFEQSHAGATAARNLGVKSARGNTIVFIDSDMVVVPSFLASHAQALQSAYANDGDDRAFTYGRVVNTSDFEDPTAEPFKVTDYSAAFFATGNVAISKRRLQLAGELLGDQNGPFDEDFSQYGWEDLELGERLRQQGARIVQCPDAVGYHWHPPFSMEQLPKLIDQERQRGVNGVRFYEKHPNLGVQLMIQMTPFHEGLWFLLTFGGLVNERTLGPLLSWLVRTGRPGLAAALLSPVLNWHTVQAVKAERRRRKSLPLQNG